MTRRWAWAGAALWLALPSGAAEATPGLADCRDPHWIAAAYQPAEFDCTQFSEREFDVDGAHYVVRALKNGSADSPEADDQAPLMLDAAAHAMQVYAKLGLRIGQVSLVFYAGHDAVVEMGSGRETGAPVPQPMARASVYSPTECLILLPLTGFTSEQTREYTPELRFTIAHEAAHCVQDWNWKRQAIYLYAPGGWWAEGSADAFATAAEPLERMTRAFIADFDAASATTSLTALAYETSPFFMWLWQQRRDRFTALMHCVTTGQPGIGSDMENDCLLASVGKNALRDFAGAYFDRTIRTLGDEDAGVNPQIPETADGSAGAATLAGDVPLFTFWRGRFILGAGVWRVTSERMPEISGLRSATGWLNPEGATITIACGASSDITVYAMPSSAAEQRFTFTAKRIAETGCG